MHMHKRIYTCSFSLCLYLPVIPAMFHLSRGTISFASEQFCRYITLKYGLWLVSIRHNISKYRYANGCNAECYLNFESNNSYRNTNTEIQCTVWKQKSTNVRTIQWNWLICSRTWLYLLSGVHINQMRIAYVCERVDWKLLSINFGAQCRQINCI